MSKKREYGYYDPKQEYFALQGLITDKPNPYDFMGLWREETHRVTRKKVRVLFLGGGKRVSLLERFIQAAYEEDIELEFFCYELLEQVHIANRATVIVGKPFSEFSVADLDEVCLKYNIDLVVPLMDAAVPVCSLYKERGPHAQMFVPDYKVADVCYDKLAFVEWIKENGLSDLYPWPNKYPFFAKSRFGYGSRKQGIVRRKSDIEKLPSDEYIFQDLLEPPEYTVDCYVNKYGGVISAVPRKRLLVVRGEVENSVTVVNDHLIRACRRLLTGRGFSGPVTVQFMEDKVIEINARFGGGVILAIEAGADHVKMLLRDYLGKNLIGLKYRPNVLMLRSYRETFFEDYNADS